MINATDGQTFTSKPVSNFREHSKAPKKYGYGMNIVCVYV